MRVLYVNHTSLISGAEHSLLTLLAVMDRERIAGFACPPGPLAERAERLGLEVHAIAGTGGSFRLHPVQTPIAIAGLMRTGLQLRGIARRTGAEILHANSVRAGLGSAIAKGGGGLPLVVHVRDCLPDGAAGRMVKGVLLRHADRLVAISRHVQARFAGAEDSPTLKRKLRVVENPVDVSRFAPSARANDDERAPTLAIIGQISSWKGHDTVIRALPAVRSRFPEARLQIVGEVKFAEPSTRLDNRAYMTELKRLIEQFGLTDAVQFLGEREDVPEIMAASAAVLVPSIEEPFGRTVAEAMAVAAPVIATSVGGPAELIEDGVTGTLAPPGSPEAWAQAILGVIEDRPRARRMAERASAQARVRFDARRHAAALTDIYAELLTGAAR